jgi:hypothetical protein
MPTPTREAIELYRAASKSALAAHAKDESCRDVLARATAAAELARAPSVLYRDVYAFSKLFDGAPCEALFASVLKTVEAYRPSNEELAALEAEILKQKAEAAIETAPAHRQRFVR